MNKFPEYIYFVILNKKKFYQKNMFFNKYIYVSMHMKRD